MSVRRLHHQQPESFMPSGETLAFADLAISRYPAGRQASAVIPLLWKIHEQDGWICEPAIRWVADRLSMPYIRVLEVVTFYTMFNLSPPGTHFLQVCATTPCWLRGSDQVVEACRQRIGPEGTVRADGKFSWMEVECLGACVNAPTIQLRSDFYEDLDYDKTIALIEALERGEIPKPGSAVGRHSSEPAGGATTLTDLSVGGDD